MPSARVDFDSIDAAAVALLEPVLAAGPDWRGQLEAGLARLADAALRVDAMPELETLAELAVLLQARLFEADGMQAAEGAGPGAEFDAALRTRAAAWVTELLDLCAGRLDPAQAGELADDADLARRTAELAASIAACRDDGDRPQPMIARDEGAEPRPTIARDELAMLAEEAAVLADELVEAGTDAAGAVLADGLERIGDAVGLLGFEALADALARRADPRSADMQADALRSLPDALARRFASAGADRSALDLLAEAAAWSTELPPGLVQAVQHEFDGLQLVASRRVGLPESGDDEPELSLAIPPDADRSVVDTLLTELPLLSAQLSERIAAADATDRDALVAAQRIAHTLKGSANTVGVRGIATITHRLEDLLQLVAGRPERLSAPLRELLEDAADCVAEMCEAVAGAGPAPAQAAELHARMTDWIARLLGAPAATADEPAPEASPAEAATDTGVESGSGVDAAAQPPAFASPDAEIRVPAGLVGRLLELVDEAAILVAHAREQALELERSRATMRLGGDQLQDLASELERLVDIRGLALDEQRQRPAFDSLELDEYNDLHTVSRRIAESGADGKLVEQQLGSNLAAVRDSLDRLERLQAELRDCALRTRMASFGSIVPRLQRTVRQAARMAGREAVLLVDGADTLVDAGMLALLVDALAHLLRNAVDHGIEPPGQRLARGKPSTGTIRLTAARSDAGLALHCADDGNGIDLDAVRERALALGLIDADARPDPSTLHSLVLANGLSTRERASQLSGRGIGLDVVRQAVDGLRGSIEIDSQPGQGTRFTIRVPLGLASMPVMLLRAPGLALALSVRGIERIVPAPPPASVRGEGVPPLRLDGVDWPLLTIESVLGLPPDTFDDDAVDDTPVARSALLLRGADGRRSALVVPEPEAPRSVVVRPMPAFGPRRPGIGGVAVLGDGAVAPVLDLAVLLAAHADGSLDAGTAAPQRPMQAARQMPRCLVVDDSVSVRRTMEQFVSDLGFRAEGAADGIEALERVRRHVPDLLLVDMEMPRMNGAELVRTLRADPRTAAVPVIMITSRYSERHKRLALDAGVDVFLTKPYTEDTLAARIHAGMAAASAGAPAAHAVAPAESSPGPIGPGAEANGLSPVSRLS